MKSHLNLPAPRRTLHLSGHTMTELLTTVAVLAILVSAGGYVWSGLKKDGAELKLISQVKMLNESVSICRANGGQIQNASTADEVIDALKMVASEDSAKRINGYRGATVDLQLRGVMQTPAEAATDQRRVIWNGDNMRFEIHAEGAAGYKHFELDDMSAESAPEDRQTTMDLAVNSRWVWDYGEFSSGPPAMDPPGTRDGAPGDPPDGTEYPGILQLNPPYFSVPGGTYEWNNYDLPLSFTNPNPPGVSEVFYSIGESEYVLYTGEAVMVAAGDTVTAYSVSIDPDSWYDSELEAEDYESSFIITGSTAGLFSNPTGGPDMVTGGWGNYFTWGTPAMEEGFTDPSWVLYEGASFYDVMPGEQFLLGSIEYHNGTILGGTGATGIDLSITLSFADDTEQHDFDYDISLINTANLEGNTQEESADYVQFGQIAAEVPAFLGGVEYTLVLAFGETTENGFSTIDEFHVFEGESATGQLYGTLVPAWGGEEG